MSRNCLHFTRVKASRIFIFVILIQVCLAINTSEVVTDAYPVEETTNIAEVTSSQKDLNERQLLRNDTLINSNYSNLQNDNEITTNSNIKYTASTTQIELVDDLLLPSVISRIDRPNHDKNGAEPVDVSESVAHLPEPNNDVNINDKTSNAQLNESHNQQNPRLSLINPKINEISEANRSEPFGEIHNINSAFKRRIALVEEPNVSTNLSKPREIENKIQLTQPAITTQPQIHNLAELSDKHLDSWRPVWPFPKLDAVPIKPTVRFPSITGHFAKIEPTPLFGVRKTDNFSVAKEPVTAYYFDLSSAIPAGPLHNSEIANSRPDTRVKVAEVDPVLHDADLSLLESSFDDYIQNSNLKLPDPIVSTPIFDQFEEDIKEDTNHNRVTSSVPVTVPKTNSTKVQETLLLNQSSLTNNSSFEYTLGNASDFQFDKVVSVPNGHSNLSNSGLQFNSNLSSDVQQSNTETIAGEILNNLIKSAFNASLKSSDRVTNSASLLDVNKDHNDISSDSLSRIPLWQRISQKTSTTLVPPVAFASTLSSALNNYLPNLSSTTSYPKYPFENDIPIGILSPGIFKSNGRFPETSFHDKSTNLGENNVTIVDDQNFQAPFLESSFQSSSQSTLIAGPTSVNKHIMTSAPVRDPGTQFSELSTPHFVDNSVLLSLFPTLPIDETLGSLVEKHTFSQTDFIVQSKSLLTVNSTSSMPVINDKNTKIFSDLMPQGTIKPTSVNTDSSDLNENAFSELPKENNLQPSLLHSNESLSFSNNFENSTIGNVQMTEAVPKVSIATEDSALLPEVDDHIKTAFNNDSKNDVITEGGDIALKGGPVVNNDDFAGTHVDLIGENESLKTTHSTTNTSSTTTAPSASTTSSTSTTTSISTTSSTSTSSSTTTANSSSGTATTTIAPPSIMIGEHKPTAEEILLVPLTSKGPMDARITQPPFIDEILPGVIRQEANSSNSSSNQEEKIIVVVGKDDEEPQLHLIKVNQDGTNSTVPSPYVKAAVSYDIKQFCKHKRNIYALLVEWINKHLTNTTAERPYEIEVFNQPECKNVYLLDNDTRLNRTDVYFYVKEDGQISPNVTLQFPKNPTELEISKELDYLKRKILHLELVNAVPSQEDLLIEEAAVGTSIVIAVIVTSLLLVLLIASVFALILIRRKRAAENIHGRRCTPAANDAYSLDSVSVFYHSIRRKSRKRASNKSLKSYLNQGFEDPNGPSRPLNFVKLTHCISDMEGIYDEFSNIPAIIPKYDEIPRGVEDKNRYANVIPVSETRILLNRNTPKEEYINANSVHGPKGELRYYIATQAPLDETVADFWEMVWEQESKVIVMLTDFVEKGIDKCADYLPPSETLDCHRVYGEFQITLKSRDLREKYIVSVVQIKNLENNLVREIAHMWFNGWPHSGVPNEEKYFISFIFDIRTTRKQLRAKGPIIVHCSPGTGRTGTFIACDLVMKQFDENKVIDIPKTVYRIRRERAGAVQTKEQYAFIYRVVNLYAAKLTTGNLDSF